MRSPFIFALGLLGSIGANIPPAASDQSDFDLNSDHRPITTSLSNQIAQDLFPFQKDYNFFQNGTNSSDGNCFAAMSAAWNHLEQNGFTDSAGKHHDCKVDMANTPFNNPNGLFSITHPSLVIHDKTTGETFVAITYIDANKRNGISVFSLGHDPNQKSIAGALMYLNRSPVVKLEQSIYANSVAWQVWDHAQPTEPGVEYCQSYASATLNDKERHELVVTSDGKLFLVRRYEDKKRIAGLYGEIKSVGLMAPVNAAASMMLDKLFSQAGGRTGHETAFLAALMASGDSITRVQLTKPLTPEFEIGVRSYLTINPNHPAQGLTKPILFANYDHNGKGIYLDQTGTASLQVRDHETKYTLGYDGINRDLSWNVGFSKHLSQDFTATLSVGKGSSIGNVNLPSALARPSTDTMGGNRTYLGVNLEWKYGKSSSSRKPGKPGQETVPVTTLTNTIDGQPITYKYSRVTSYDSSGNDLETFWTDGKKDSSGKPRKFASENELLTALKAESK